MADNTTTTTTKTPTPAKTPGNGTGDDSGGGNDNDTKMNELNQASLYDSRMTDGINIESTNGINDNENVNKLELE